MRKELRVWKPSTSFCVGETAFGGRRLVRRRVSAGVGVGALGGGSVCARRHVPTDGRRASGPPGKFFHFLSGFIWGVCVCEASSIEVVIE